MVEVQSHEQIAQAHKLATRKMYLIVLISIVLLVSIVLLLFYVNDNVAGQVSSQGLVSSQGTDVGSVFEVPQGTFTIETQIETPISGPEVIVIEPANCQDNDEDGFNMTMVGCGPIDCNDGNYLINPDAQEDCNDGEDNDCNLLTDAADPACATNLIAHWSMDLVSNDVLFDDSGNGHDGSIVGNSVISTFGGFDNGSVLLLDGDGDYVNFGDISEMEFGSSDYTISAWIKPSSSGHNIVNNGGHGAIITKYNASSSNRQWMLLHRGESTLQAYFNPTGGGAHNYVTSVPTISPDVWTHVASQRDGNDFNLYINGELVSTSPSSPVATNIASQKNAPVYVGRVGSSNRYYFNGYIDEVKVYNIAVSGHDICDEAGGTWAGNNCNPPLVISTEISCNDGIDNEDVPDGDIDCVDSDCASVYLEYVPLIGSIYCEYQTELTCDDDFDNDGDGDIDCVDPDCDSTCNALIDNDGDNVTSDQDCNDNIATVQDNMTCYRDLDSDNYGFTPFEVCTNDCDNLAIFASLPNDCNDANNSINPGATEICGNGVDEDCSGADAECPVLNTGDINRNDIVESGDTQDFVLELNSNYNKAPSDNKFDLDGNGILDFNDIKMYISLYLDANP
jgi:hypothetical protein